MIIVRFSFLLVLLSFSAETPAYVDPGTGSMLLQVVLGGVAAIGVMLKLYWHKLRNVFKRGGREEAGD